MTDDRRLTGARIPRFVDLNGPEASERIRRVVQAFRERYPGSESDAFHRAQQQAVAMMRLREEGFSEQDRADLAEWLEHNPLHAPRIDPPAQSVPHPDEAAEPDPARPRAPSG
jgi:cytochrome c553